jgi:hypothetical protein
MCGFLCLQPETAVDWLLDEAVRLPFHLTREPQLAVPECSSGDRISACGNV